MVDATEVLARWPEPTYVEHDSGFGPIRIAVHEDGPADGVPVVLCHGFPELGFSWRYQLAALADAGYRAIVPDMRGYGSTSAPHDIAAYAIDELCADLVAILDARGIDRALFAGHDWGGFVAWAMPLLHPDRCLGVIGVCTPYMPMPPTAVLRAVFPDPERLYILWFQDDGVAESVMDPHADRLFRVLMRGGISPDLAAERAVAADGLPDANPFRRLADDELAAGGAGAFGELICTEAELAVYIDAYEKTGFRGGINWYRNIDGNQAIIPTVGTQPLDLPCLMLCAEWDFALRPEMADGMPAVIADLERHDIARAGHWVQQEAASEVNAHLIDWLQRRFPA